MNSRGQKVCRVIFKVGGYYLKKVLIQCQRKCHPVTIQTFQKLIVVFCKPVCASQTHLLCSQIFKHFFIAIVSYKITVVAKWWQHTMKAQGKWVNVQACVSGTLLKNSGETLHDVSTFIFCTQIMRQDLIIKGVLQSVSSFLSCSHTVFHSSLNTLFLPLPNQHM